MAQRNVDIIVRARDEASRKFGVIGRSANAMGSMLRSAAIGVAAYFSAREIISFAKSSIEAFAAQQKAVMDLTAALELLGKAMQIEAMKDFASQIQRLTTVGDETALEMMKLGVSIAGLSGDDLKQATIAAIGLSKAYGIELETAMRLVSRAAVGDTATLRRYGIVLSENASDEEKFNELLAIGAEKFKLAEAEANTLTGRLTRLGNAWGDMKEQIGAMIAQSPMLSTAIDYAQTVMENFGLSMEIVWTKVGLWLVKIWEDMKHIFTVAIPAYLQYFLENWKEIFTNIWEGTKTVLLNMWENFKNFFSALWSWIKGEQFEFVWTGLLDGFKSTLEEMKPIAQRQVGEVEKIMSEELADKLEQFRKAAAEKSTMNMTQFGKAKLGEKNTESGEAGKVAAVESRFLSGITTAGPAYDKETAKNTKRQIAILERIEKVLQQKGISNGIVGQALQLEKANLV
ncbi:MAG TPA: hypothetical protein PK052_06865 [Anaerohalosphaeraceae bacterium]|nr:hypothetical protein [Anaerohalosphaeraceae bacterium]HOL31688.1 hypothetical protein [Anaerohalosphaeraceae bacterium]